LTLDWILVALWIRLSFSGGDRR